MDALIASYSSSPSADREKNCARLVKRLKRERGMLFTFLEEEGVEWNNNAAERALRPSVVIRKMTYGNQSEEGAQAHADPDERQGDVQPQRRELLRLRHGIP